MYEHILVTRDGGIGQIQLNRPQVLNALNRQAVRELVDAALDLDADPLVRSLLICGNDQAFAAGADIKENAPASAVDMIERETPALWARFRRVSKPVIAAVSGHCLGGGFELALSCDMIIASETARFGLPEVRIGIMPGAGGTQRLTRAVGKALAMEVILFGRTLSAQEAAAFGLVNRVTAPDRWLDEARALAATMASRPAVAVRLAREAILKADDLSLEAGLDFERRNACLCFATADQKEGMQAFIEKRKPAYQGR